MAGNEATRKLTIELLGDAKGVKIAFGEAERSSKSFGDRLRSAGKAAAVGIAAASAAAVVVGGALIAAGETAATSNARIDQIATSMGLFGSATDEVTGRLKSLADEQARLTGVNQNQIKQAQATLLTFGELAASADEVGGNFDRATKASIDLAAAGFGSVEGNAVQLGKALNDPVKGLAALAKSGVTFTEDQKKVIKSLVETGKVGEAQNLVLKAIEQQVGGTGAATANASDQMRVAFSQVAERLGEKLLPTFNRVSQWVVEKGVPAFERFETQLEDKVRPVLKAISDWWDRNGPTIISTARRIAEVAQQAVAVAFDKVRGAFEWVNRNSEVMIPLLAGILAGFLAFKVIQGVMAAITFATQAWSAAQVLLNVVLSANPIGIVVIAIAALVAAFVVAWKRSETFRDTVKGAFIAVSDTVEKVVGAITGFWGGLWGGIKTAAIGALDFVIDAFNRFIRFWNGLDLSIPEIHIPGTNIDVGGFTIGLPDIPELRRLAAGSSSSGSQGGVQEFQHGGLNRETGLRLIHANERVLSARQTASFERLVGMLDRTAGLSGGVTLQLVFQGDVADGESFQRRTQATVERALRQVVGEMRAGAGAA